MASPSVNVEIWRRSFADRLAPMDTAHLSIRLVATTQFTAPDEIDWTTDVDGGQALVEFSGRACYQSWAKPNPDRKSVV